MFREMRRKRQQLPEEESLHILQRNTAGVLSVIGDDDYPYAVPISYVLVGRKLYFHGAKDGHKVNSIRRCSKASFCVIDQDQIVPEEYTSYFRSVIAFGRIRILEDKGEILSAITEMALKYYPTDSSEGRSHAIQKDWKPLCMLEFTIEHMTGKEAIELRKNR